MHLRGGPCHLDVNLFCVSHLPFCLATMISLYAIASNGDTTTFSSFGAGLACSLVVSSSLPSDQARQGKEGKGAGGRREQRARIERSS